MNKIDLCGLQVLLNKLNNNSLKEKIDGKIYIEITHDLAFEINQPLNRIEYLIEKKKKRK